MRDALVPLQYSWPFSGVQWFHVSLVVWNQELLPSLLSITVVMSRDEELPSSHCSTGCSTGTSPNAPQGFCSQHIIRTDPSEDARAWELLQSSSTETHSASSTKCLTFLKGENICSKLRLTGLQISNVYNRLVSSSLTHLKQLMVEKLK